MEELDLSKNKILQELYCRTNQLTSLELIENETIKKVDCAYNNLEELNLINNNELEEVDCSYNDLKIITAPLKRTVKVFKYQGNNALTSPPAGY